MFTEIMSFFDTATSFIGETFDVISEWGSSFTSFFGDGDSIWGSISGLAGDILVEGAQTYMAAEASKAALKSGESAADIFYGNADLYYDQALLVEGRTNDEVTKARLNGVRFMSRQIVAYSKAGVTMEGSPLLVLNETRDLLEMQVQQIVDEGTNKAEVLRKQGEIEEKKAKNALDDAEFRAQMTMANSFIESGKRWFA